mmetsp:Transcript_10138/g.12648  ORF Transcript_10138/g.12648 Transcript_10138/m.12648 type:complete len:111 (-) Transcript_10138:418-750(-)
MCIWIRKTLNIRFDELNKEGHSAFHKAAFKGNVALLKWCICEVEKSEILSGCKPDNKLQRPSDIALRCGHAQFANLVKAYEVDSDNLKRKAHENHHVRKEKLQKVLLDHY